MGTVTLSRMDFDGQTSGTESESDAEWRFLVAQHREPGFLQSFRSFLRGLRLGLGVDIGGTPHLDERPAKNKGRRAEDLVFSFLQRRFSGMMSTTTVELCRAEPCGCDMVARQRRANGDARDVRVEIKHYATKSLPRREIDKFHRDLELNDAHGVLVALVTPPQPPRIELVPVSAEAYAVHLALSTDEDDLCVIADMIELLFRIPRRPRSRGQQNHNCHNNNNNNNVLLARRLLSDYATHVSRAQKNLRIALAELSRVQLGAAIELLAPSSPSPPSPSPPSPAPRRRQRQRRRPPPTSAEDTIDVCTDVIGDGDNGDDDSDSA